MDNKYFKDLRLRLGKTQDELAILLGTSLKTIRSYEQGWRNIPVHAERQLYLLVSKKRNIENKLEPCWVLKKCPPDRKERCPAWEFGAGNLCWFISGTMCKGCTQSTWIEKMEICKPCDVFKAHIGIGDS